MHANRDQLVSLNIMAAIKLETIKHAMPPDKTAPKRRMHINSQRHVAQHEATSRTVHNPRGGWERVGDIDRNKEMLVSPLFDAIKEPRIGKLE
jgi:hypothetical protein